jgi:hypothetical protein
MVDKQQPKRGLIAIMNAPDAQFQRFEPEAMAALRNARLY